MRRGFWCSDGSKGGFEDAETFVELPIGDDERHEQADGVAVGAGRKNHQAMLVAVSKHGLGFFGGRLPGFSGAHEFESTHGAEAAHVADERASTLPGSSSFGEPLAEHLGVAAEIGATGPGFKEVKDG